MKLNHRDHGICSGPIGDNKQRGMGLAGSEKGSQRTLVFKGKLIQVFCFVF